MTEENKNGEKISFIKKHATALFIAIIAAGAGAVITVVTTEYFNNSPIRELLVVNDDSVSLINGDLPAQITANYFLKGRPNKKIKSLFFKKIAVKNDGNEDGENIPLSVFLKGKNIFLVDNPTIKTEPKEIIDIIKIRKEVNSTSNEHIWNIPLLKPGETITFEYMIYSEEKIKVPRVNVLVRKKGWQSKKGVFSDSSTQKTIINFILIVFSFMLGGFIVGLVSVMTVILSTKKFREEIKSTIQIAEEIEKGFDELD